MTNASSVRAGIRVSAAACAAGMMLAAQVAQAATISVAAGGNLQAALNAAQPGDIILLQPGAVFQGKFTLPLKSNPENLFITVRSAAADDALPADGVRMTPAYASVLPKLKSADNAQVLYVPPGASYWRVQFVEFQANANGSGDIVRVGSHLETVPTNQPHHIVFDRLYVHGDPDIGQKNGIVAHASAFELRNSHISDIKLVGMETHAFLAYNGPGPYLLENNYLEAAGINVLIGGADPTNAAMIPSDITVRRNHVAKDLAWMTPRPDGRYWNVKNLFELKSGRRATITGNTFEHNWTGAGDQPGYAILFRTENQSGACTWCETSAVLFENNIVRHSPSGMNLIGLDYPSGGTPAGVRMNNVSVRNNLFDDLDPSRWYVGATKPVGRFALINGVDALAFDHNTIVGVAPSSVVYFTGSYDSPGFAFTNNMSVHGLYGIKGDSTAVGTGTLTAYTAGYVVTANVLAGGNASAYPAGNFFPSIATWQANFLDFASRNYRLLAASVYRNAGTDGLDLGADIDRIEAAINPTPDSANRPPVTDGVSGSTLEDTLLPITLVASDPDDDPLSFEVSAGPAHGTLAGTAPSLIYTPAADFNGSDGFTFSVSDGKDGTATGTVTITIAPVNDVPVANAVAVETLERTPMRFTLDASDVDDSVLTYAVPATIASGTLTQIDGPLFEYVPAAGFSGTDTAEYTVRDAALGTATASIAVSVTTTNDAPVASSPSVTTTAGTAVAIVLVASDPDGDALAWSVGGPLHGTVSGIPPSITYMPAAGFVGIDSFTYAVSDGQLSASGTVTVDVQPAPPVVTVVTTTLADSRVGRRYSQVLQASGGTTPYRWSIAAGALPLGLTLNAGNGKISGTTGTAGTYSFTVRVADAGGAAGERTLSIRVIPAR